MSRLLQEDAFELKVDFLLLGQGILSEFVIRFNRTELLGKHALTQTDLRLHAL